MPNRILREGILTSERVDALSSWAVECFYRRLHSIVDDFGRYYGNPSLIRAAAYPLKLDKVSNADIDKWLAECAGAGLVSTYEVDGKRYVQLLDFRQQKRAEVSKFPDLSAASATHPHSNGVANEHLGGGEGVVGNEGDIRGAAPPFRKQAAEIIKFLNGKAGRNYDVNGANADHVVARLKEGATVDDCRAVIALKCREWRGDDKMSKYLRPETLFNRTKFATYKGELGAAEHKVDL